MKKTSANLIIVANALLLSLAIFFFYLHIKNGSFFVLSFFLFFTFFVLLPTFNIAYIFASWKSLRFSAVTPFLSYVCCLVIMISILHGDRPVLFRFATQGTPRDPKSFLSAHVRKDLENISKSLLGRGYRCISVDPADSSIPSHVEMANLTPVKKIPDDTENALRTYGFRETWIDDTASVIIFRHYSQRVWYEYIFTTNTTLPKFTFPVSESRGIDHALGDGWYYRAW